MRSHKILVVDDDDTTTEIIEDILASHYPGCIIKTQNSCVEMLGMIIDFLPDLLIIGYNNFDVRGDVVVRAVKKQHALQHMKILGMSGHCLPAEVERWKQAGIDSFIKKPFPIDFFLGEVEALLNIRQ